jgi:hypothetical protein
VFEKKAEDREKLCRLFVSMYTEDSSGAGAGLLSSAEATRGVLAFLNEFDDIVIDVPLAVSSTSQ